MKNITKINLEREKKVIIKRIKDMKGEEIKTEENDDNKLNSLIELEVENMNQIDERAIKSSDFSYNLVHIENFISAGLHEYNH